MITRLIFLSLLNGMVLFLCAQEPLAKIDFEDDIQRPTTKGIIGRALDLGNVPKRLAVPLENPLKSSRDFTVLMWVKADTLSDQSYDILSSVSDVEYPDKGWKRRTIDRTEKLPVKYNGWKIGIQSNGAWEFTARNGKRIYHYQPMPYRQTIRNGNWHLLGVSFDGEVGELRFYYNGQQVAVYRTPDLLGMEQADSLVIGNGADSEHDFHTTAWDTFYGQVDDITLYDRVVDGNWITTYYQQTKGKVVVDPPKIITLDSLKVTAFNIWDGGNMAGKEVGLNYTIELLKKEQADIITLVETYGSGEEIADALGYQLYLISSNLSIISRYPIKDTYPIFKPFNSGGAKVMLPNGQPINVFAVWLNYRPNYRLMLMEEGVDLEEYMKEEQRTRGSQMETILAETAPLLKIADSIPLVMAGDFNTGSHLDWNEDTAPSHNGYIVPWPVTLQAEHIGLIDSYRRVCPDPIRNPGITISLGPSASNMLKDRIDYIFFKGKKLEPIQSNTFDTHPVSFPSDHAGVSTLFKWRHNPTDKKIQ